MAESAKTRTDGEAPGTEMQAMPNGPWTANSAAAECSPQSAAEPHHELSAELAHMVDENTYLMKLSTFAAARPSKMFAGTCGSCCSVFVILLVLIVAAPGFFPFESQVPLYLRHNVARERLDAVNTAKDDSDFILHQPEVQLRSSVASLGGAREDTTLEIIYIAKEGSVFELKNIQAIFDFERKITSKNGYKERCYINYPQAERAVQEARDWAGVEAINAQPHACAPPLTLFYACDPTNGHPCESLSSTPVGILDCPQAGTCTEDEFVVSEPFKDAKLQTYARAPVNKSTEDGANALSFYELVDSGFSDGNLVAKAVRTEFVFGAPFKGYATVIDDADGQSQELADFLFEEYYDFLIDMEVNDDIEIIFNGHGMFQEYVNSIMVSDAMFAVAAMLFSWVYMSFMLQSVFLATMGIGQIVLSFGPSYFFYFLVFQQRYFGLFNVLSIFIILGIGADDIFVFIDTWEQAEHALGTADLSKRLAYTWHFAGKAMLVTSTTTVFSFASNAASSFPAIQTFGVFAALLVLVNYCAVMVHFPMCVLVHEVYLAKKPFLGGCAEKVREFCRGGAPAVVVARSTTDDGASDGSAGKDEPAANRWFRNSFGSVVINLNVGILVAFALATVVLAIAAARLEVDKDDVQLLPGDNNFQRFSDEKPEYFVRGGAADAVLVQLVWGLDPEDPIDRAGTMPTDMEDFGEVNYDANFNLAVAAECIASVCDAAERKSDERKTAGPSSIPIDCVVADFKQHVLATYDQSTWDAITGLNADTARFTDLLRVWVSDPDVSALTSEYTFPISDGAGSVASMMVLAELKLTVRRSNLEPTDGIAIWHTWEAFVAEQFTLSPCLEVKPQAGMFQASLDGSFAKDKLRKEAMGGIVLSIGLAGIVLLLATQNLLMSLYATLMITMIVISTMGTTVLMGWKLGVLESIGFVMVPGLSVDFVAHFADSYIESHEQSRHGRLKDMLATSGVAIASGAFSTLGATLFLFFPQIVFYVKFGTMIFITIGFSLFWSMLCFPAILSTPLGPQGDTGNWLILARRLISKCKGGPSFASTPEVHPTPENNPLPPV
ncbi:Protein dispatched [Diplonema papillatum]|nr:Protein dispatched [Diplonema papillatum]